MAQYLIRTVGIVFTVILLLTIATWLLRPAQAGEMVPVSSSDEQSGESAPIYLVIVIGTVLLAGWMWADKMWGSIPS